MSKVAFFDIDGTITRHSTERKLIPFLLASGVLSKTNVIFSTIGFIASSPFEVIRQGFKTNKTYLAGLHENVLADAAGRCFDRHIRGDIRASMREEIKQKRAEGCKIVLLSGSLSALVKIMANEFSADGFIGTVLEAKKGVITGRMSDVHPYDSGKAFLAERFCKQGGFEISEAVAYGNEEADLSLLNLVAEPVAVAPDVKLRSAAVANGWRIIED